MRRARKMHKDELKLIRHHIINNDFFFDGVDESEDNPFSNQKTSHYIDNVGIDEALDTLIAVISNPDKAYVMLSDNWWEEDEAWILIRGDMYVKVFKLYAPKMKGPFVVIHP